VLLLLPPTGSFRTGSCMLFFSYCLELLMFFVFVRGDQAISLTAPFAVVTGDGQRRLPHVPMTPERRGYRVPDRTFHRRRNLVSAPFQSSIRGDLGRERVIPLCPARTGPNDSAGPFSSVNWCSMANPRSVLTKTWIRGGYDSLHGKPGVAAHPPRVGRVAHINDVQAGTGRHTGVMTRLVASARSERMVWPTTDTSIN
jgi:hypothetical protein